VLKGLEKQNWLDDVQGEAKCQRCFVLGGLGRKEQVTRSQGGARGGCINHNEKGDTSTPGKNWGKQGEVPLTRPRKCNERRESKETREKKKLLLQRIAEKKIKATEGAVCQSKQHKNHASKTSNGNGLVRG